MISVTARMVRSLSLFDDADAAIAAAARNLPDERAKVDSTTGVILMPGEAGYEDAVDNIENGWVRLYRH